MFTPDTLVIHNSGGTDHTTFDGNGLRHILDARWPGKSGGYHVIHERVDGASWSTIFNRLDRPSIHVKDHNGHCLGFAIVGNFNETVPDDELLLSAAEHVASLLNALRIPRLMPHRSMPDNNTDCPGNKFPWVRFAQMVKDAGAAPVVGEWRV